MKFELSVDADYLSDGHWDAAAGVREFMQNARDAAIEQGAPLTVTHRIDSQGRGVLVIENEGAVLTKDTLLMGRTTKRDRQSELAGKYGEGYKLGSLALLRSGYEVKIRNGGEVWIPSIEPSEKFDGRPVLVFTIATGRADRNRVQVEITGVDADAWKVLKEHYLFLYKREVKQVETPHGALLLAPKFRGRVYVKDILVTTDPALEFGYNLPDAELDRDRRIIESYDLESRTQRIWSSAVDMSPGELFDDYYRLLKNGARDVKGLTNFSTYTLSAGLAEKVAAQFLADHGTTAIPVKSMADSKDIEHLGARGIVAQAPLAAALAKTLGDTTTIKARLQNEVTERFSWSDLTDIEKVNLERAIALVNAQAPVSLDDVEVVAFRSDDLQGLFQDGRIMIGRSQLPSRSDTLEVMVHEVAHRQGGDGDKHHVAEIERIWAGIVEGLG